VQGLFRIENTCPTRSASESTSKVTVLLGGGEAGKFLAFGSAPIAVRNVITQMREH